VPFRVEAIFRHNVFMMLLAKGKITRELIAMLSSWRHSGFHVFCGNRISPNDETAMENLARYIIYPEGHKTGVSRWCGTMAITVMSSVVKGSRKELMMPSPASSNLRETKRLSGKVGLG
jgi:hypothetical protein